MKSFSRGFSSKEKKLISLLNKKVLSSSHNWDHLENVLFFALELGKIYKAKREILIPACLLHDLGRTNPKLHGKDSLKESAHQAKILLKKAGYSSGEIDLICQVIKEHDQPKLKSKILESRILKDADFLDGFGTRGILRAIYWMGESGRPFDKNLSRLRKKMRQRYESLEFPESRKMARSGFLLAQVFFDHLKKVKKKPFAFKGKFIVFEGTSGTGKETQAKRLKKFLEKRGFKTKILYHPTKRLKNTLKKWRKDNIDLFTEALMFIADRHDVISQSLLPALKNGKVVISLRNEISTLVYQARTKEEINLFEYLYGLFAPEPDIIFYFRFKPEKALERILKRTRETGEERGKFENIKDLKAKRKRYQKIIKRYKNVIRLDASLSKDKIHKRIIKTLERQQLI